MADNVIARMEEVLDEDHWITGEYVVYDYAEDHGVAYCLVGAARRAVVGWSDPEMGRDFRSALSILADVIRREYPDRYEVTDPEGDIIEEAVIHFNDHEQTGWPDIETVLGKARLEWEEATR